ncbi:hypothetical protein ABEG18_12965 [Alsobacter sp. KACC 23698]|uniref:Uncharacterized protein n=1 Tax=Alsobacter sp. KACC 23698 TaxID=3149229 RepID=A0AAU7JMV8_9HYPH
MAALDLAIDKLVTSSTGNLKDAKPLDARDFAIRALKDMGFSAVSIGNTAPADKAVLWWHKDVRTAKRYDAVLANWYPLTPNQHAMHLVHRVVKGAVTEINLEAGDLFVFWDVSLGEAKVISRESLMNALGAVRTITTNQGVKGGGSLAADRTLSLDVTGLTAKASPSPADEVAIYDVAGTTNKKITIAKMAEALAISDYLHSEMFFLGMM